MVERVRLDFPVGRGWRAERELHDFDLMRAWRVMLIVGLMTAESGVCGAQERTLGRPTAGSTLNDPNSRSEGSTGVIYIPVQRLLGKWQPVRERVAGDDRLRMLSGALGLGVLVYEAIPSRSALPVEFIGTEALRLGLHPQLNMLRERTGYTVEPSVGRRRFAVTFRKTLE